MTADEICALSDEDLCRKAGRIMFPMLDIHLSADKSRLAYDFAMRLREKVLGYGKSQIILDNGNVEANCANGQIDLWHDGASEKAECRAILQACLFVMEVSGE